ncbi:MAG TPA: helix-turn-helix transcriptional regulator [Ktedonobacterales bacterium]|nr:helix-turn-helix transcriptional regulator [Ktedonobacterales bacterium]
MRLTPYEAQFDEAKLIGERLRWVRELVDATPTQLAADLGVDVSAVRHIERGVRSPSLVLLMTICHVLRISPQYLLWGRLEGIDRELAVKLKSLHPELILPTVPKDPDSTRNSRRSSGARPRTRARYHSAMAE